MDDFDQFERSLSAALRADADVSVTPFEPGAIAVAAVSGVGQRAPRRERRLAAGRAADLRPVAIAAVIGVIVVGGAIFMIQGIAPDLIGRPSPTPNADPSPSLPGVVVPTASDLPGEPTSSPVVNQTGVWVATGSMGTPREGHTAVRLLDGRVLVAGGVGLEGDDPVPLTSAELYDPVTGTWSTTGDMIHPQGAFQALLLPDGTVLVGDVPDAHADIVGAELYDPATGTWSRTRKDSVVAGTATLLANGTVLVTGPRGSELFDPSTGDWTATGTMTTPRYNHTATLLPDGRVLVAGGDVNPDRPTHSAELYDPNTGTWTATTSLSGAAPSGQHVHPVATLLPDGTVLVVHPSSAERYDPGTETWTATTEQPTAGGGAASATLLSDGLVLVTLWGVDGVPRGSARSELYDPGTDSWATTAGGSEPLQIVPATLLFDGTVLRSGGAECVEGVCLMKSSAELYVPAGVPVPSHIGTHPEPEPTVFPTPTPVPTPYPPAAGPDPAGGRPWTVTVVNDSPEPVTLFVAEEDEDGMSRLVGSVTPNVVPPETTIEVTLLLPAADTRGWWIFVNPPTHGSLLGWDEVPRAGQFVIQADGQVGWLGA